MIFEICIDSVEGALAAQAAGAQRVELCDNLVEGGTTPSLGMLQVVRRRINLGVHVIIRPRGGDFYYSPAEFEVMQQDILAARQAGADGVVIGLLNLDGTVDVERTRALVALARPLKVTFHRAFDLSRDPAESLEAICSLGIERVLTSGQQADCLAGLECITRLVQQAGERTIVMPGGGITPANAAQIAAASRVKEMHFAALQPAESPMIHRNRGCFMGSPYQPDEYRLSVTSEAEIRAVMQAARSGQGQ
ncbi:MAG: copper homeostasis protein CutC [Chloroflexota bacterium]